ncbi:hypothetical protein QT972_11045 [Microcoleus sp. herbarium7]|uniref:hypothetical protein n=1 Tax=Microcoleus sp. herbarium7 TaxID=3055435 RepID=UPI002FD697CC
MIKPTKYDAVLGGNNPGPKEGSVVMGVTNRYTNPEHKQFCLDMIRASIPVKHYNGRFFWSGPAASVSDIQDVLSYTKVKCVWDESGRDYVVYPKAYSQAAVLEVQQQLGSDTQFAMPAPMSYGSSSYKRLFDAFAEMLQFELELEVVK